uniref:Uncharacterized protein n=1 Tax=viral metagenome TaxID=1070528 RepID=A0A6M3ITA1_9ZZZZ
MSLGVGGQNVSWAERQRKQREAAQRNAGATNPTGTVAAPPVTQHVSWAERPQVQAPNPLPLTPGAGGDTAQHAVGGTTISPAVTQALQYQPEATMETGGQLPQNEYQAELPAVEPQYNEFGVANEDPNFEGSLGAPGTIQWWIEQLQQEGSMPSIAEYLSNLPGAGDIWSGVLGDAKENMGGAIDSANPENNTFTKFMQQLLSGSPDFADVDQAPITEENRPEDVTAETPLTGETDYNDINDVLSQYSVEDINKFMTDVMGAMEGVEGVNAPDVTDAGTATDDIMGEYGIGPLLESLGISKSDWENNPLVQSLLGKSGEMTDAATKAIMSMGDDGGYDEALKAMTENAQTAHGGVMSAGQDLFSTNYDTSGLLDALKGAESTAYERAMEKATGEGAGRGFSDIGGGVTGGLLGKYMGQAASDSAARTQQALLEAAGMQTEAKTAGGNLMYQGASGQTGALSALEPFLSGKANIGGEQAKLLSDLSGKTSDQGMDVANLLAGENKDVLNLLLGEQANKISGFEAGTGAAATAGDIFTNMSQLQQNSAISQYEAETGRKAVVSGALTDEASNWIDAYAQDTERHGKVAIDAYNAATERGSADTAAKEAAAAMGLEYDKLNVQQQQTFDQLMADVWQAGGQFTTEQNQLLQELYDSQLSGGAQMVDITGSQGLDFMNALTDILTKGGMAQQDANALLVEAMKGDQAGMIDLMNTILSYYSAG